MTSKYQYITATELEDYTGTDYSAVHSDYTTGVVDAKITAAEKYANTFCKQTFTGDVPDGVESAVIEMSARLMHNQLVRDKYREGMVEIIDDFINGLLEPNKKSEEVGVDSVPMSGPDRRFR